jgi:hypothetical protein
MPIRKPPTRKRRPTTTRNTKRRTRAAPAAEATQLALAPTPPSNDRAPVVVTQPEVVFAARVPAVEPPRPRPAQRRGIFFDVENSSRPEHVATVLDHLGIDWTARATELVAVGNWKVIGHETARLLAHRGAQLVHSAPSAGVRDWSDLRIAVAAGAWLAAARPGDSIEIVSDDQAFDAVGDVAASLGVTFDRLSFRALAGLGVAPAAPTGHREPQERRRRRRRGRGESARGRPPEARPSPPHRASPQAIPAAVPEPHTAPADEIRTAVEDLLDTSPGGVTLDALSNTLKARGFRRPPGSPRLITRLRHLKGLEVTPAGIVRLVSGAPSKPGAESAPPEALAGSQISDDSEQASGVATEPLAPPAPPRRRRRRRGRRRRAGDGQGAAASPEPIAQDREPVQRTQGF